MLIFLEVIMLFESATEEEKFISIPEVFSLLAYLTYSVET